MSSSRFPSLRPNGEALRKVVAPFQAFFRLEASGGLVMIGSAILALVWANSPLRGLYVSVFHTEGDVHIAGHAIGWTLQHLTNDALMALFFVVAGLEIKRELVLGELRTLQRAALPLVAALGGMVAPALIYLAFNPEGPARAGWGVPMATDIAFALGCLSLVRRRVPTSVFVFLTALAIFDDLGAIVVIAVFYGGDISLLFLGLSGLCTLGLLLLARARIQALWPYLLVGLLLWFAVLRSGVHATLAGVVLGLCIPSSAPEGKESPLDRLQQKLHRVVAFGIVPLFALANAGVVLGGGASLGSGVTRGAMAGLVVGKPVGVLGATWIALKTKLAPRPTGATGVQLLAAGLLAGIGFTMSLFVGNLGLGHEKVLEDSAKLGVLLASGLSAVLGLFVLRAFSPLRAQDEADA